MIHAFLLIGQSNMAGRGYLDEAVPVDQSRIRILRNGRWQNMFRPINPDRSFSGVNLAESFAECYAKKYDADVGLICCADGGTGLDQWVEGSILFDNAVSQAKLAQRTSVLKGILWHQGEADCGTDLYPTYEKRLTAFIAAIRKALDVQDVPFLMGGLGDYLKDCPLDDNLKNYVHINDAMKCMAQKDPSLGFVSAEGLTSNPDYLHFNAKALHEFGVRYFHAFEPFAKAGGTETVVCDDTRRTAMELL